MLLGNFDFLKHVGSEVVEQIDPADLEDLLDLGRRSEIYLNIHAGDCVGVLRHFAELLALVWAAVEGLESNDEVRLILGLSEFQAAIFDLGIRTIDRQDEDAFHSIRKAGNLAVHPTGSSFSRDDALDLMRRCHELAVSFAWSLASKRKLPTWRPDNFKFEPPSSDLEGQISQYREMAEQQLRSAEEPMPDDTNMGEGKSLIHEGPTDHGDHTDNDIEQKKTGRLLPGSEMISFPIRGL